jgi:hypothetical protein
MKHLPIKNRQREVKMLCFYQNEIYRANNQYKTQKLLNLYLIEKLNK